MIEDREIEMQKRETELKSIFKNWPDDKELNGAKNFLYILNEIFK